MQLLIRVGKRNGLSLYCGKGGDRIPNAEARLLCSCLTTCASEPADPAGTVGPRMRMSGSAFPPVDRMRKKFVMPSAHVQPHRY
jgi:hypothetical protein